MRYGVLCELPGEDCVHYRLFELEDHRGRPSTPIESAACGALGGVVAGAVTTPLDVVKTRMMLNTGRRERASSLLLRLVRRPGLKNDGTY